MAATTLDDRYNSAPRPPTHARAWQAAVTCCALLSFAACQAAKPDEGNPSTVSASEAAGTGESSAAGRAGQAAPAGALAMARAAAGTSASAGISQAGATAASTNVAKPAAGSGAIAAAGGGAGQPATADVHDHCVMGEHADTADAQLTGMPDEWKSSSGNVDLVLPKAVLAWMNDRVWEQSHDAWHNVRRCRGGGMGGFFPGGMTGTSSLCTTHPDLVAAHSECSDAEDGYQFLVMHRHMLQALRQAFPQHQELFAGFPHFPFAASEVPEAWRARWGSDWSAEIKTTAMTLEEIENKLSQFATEGDLGKFIQCGGMGSGASSIHGALHFKWVVNDSPYSLGKQTVNIDNYMFWKLHGWIDGIWERYRVAKGLAPSEPKLVESLIDQCREMHALGVAIDPSKAVDTSSPLPVEHGVFHETVRPILEKTCASCHSESSPEAGLTLGGHVSSADIVKGMVSVQTMHGGQFKRVVPKSPEQSWLYLKAAGKAAAAGCMGTACNNQVMPPAGQVTLSSAELDTIQRWISDGAAAPTP